MANTDSSASKGFTLLEMLAVLALMAILAALLLPGLVKHTDFSTRAQEANNLLAIRDALLLHAVRSNNIPDVASWQQAAADWSRFSVSQVATNARRYSRLYFLRSGPTPGLPYTQGPNGTTQPANLRAIVVSLLGGDPLSSANCPAPGGGYLTDADFDALWNTPDGSRPTVGAWANWKGAGDDFLAQRVDYTPLLHRLVLVNRDPRPAYFTINGSSPSAITNNPNNNLGWTAYYLDGTTVGLFGTNGTILTSCVLTRDIGFIFEGGLWRAQITGLYIADSQAQNFTTNAAAFLASQWYSGAKQGADQQSALVCMYTFMYTYTLWANQCPHFPDHCTTTPEKVPEYMLLQSIADRNKTLYNVTGTGGLLK